jgi:hypothetical protein
MRQDAKSLLDRLNRQEFRYQDFTEAAEEIELWPLFQALLRDPRIVGVRSSASGLVEVPQAPHARMLAEAAPSPANAASPQMPVARAVHDAPGTLFDRYRATGQAPAVSDREPDLRGFLSRIGEDRA